LNGRRAPRRRTFALIMMLAAALALLPTAWTSWTRHLIDPLVWTRGTLRNGIAYGVLALRGPIGNSSTEAELREQLDGLRRQLAQQSLMLDQTQRQLETVAGIAGQFDRHQPRILIATITAVDASATRSSATLSRGSIDGVRTGMWVVAGARPHSAVDADTGRDLLLRQWVIGRVAEAGASTSRVQLASDALFGPIRVRAAVPLPDGSLQLLAAEGLLYGRGNGRMEIEEASVNFHEAGANWVLANVGASVPIWLSIGRIVGGRALPESSLHFNHDVRPWAEASQVDYVYVLLPGDSP
jgi:cell shape-determining protein MreC